MTLVRTWKQAKRPSAEGWTKKTRARTQRRVTSARKRDTPESVLMRQMNLQPITEGRKPEREGQILYNIIHTWNLEECTDELICSAEIETQTREQTSVYQGGKVDR